MDHAEMTLMDSGYKPPPRGEDLPTSDGEPMETTRHREQMVLLIATLQDAWRSRDDYYVGGDMFVYYSELQAKHRDFRGPDVFVVMDTVKRERKSWVVWEEDGRAPDVVIELTSPSTEHIDHGDKMRVYARLLRVAEYYVFDPFTARLEAFEVDPETRAYRPRTADAQGRFNSVATGLTLGVVPGRAGDIDANWLRWIDAAGNVLPTGQERAEREAERAEREAERADAAVRRVAELEARLGSS